jgi:hypothetical protein
MTEPEPPEIDPIELYRKYRATLSQVTFRGQFLSYGWGQLPPSLHMVWMPYREWFQEYANEIANIVNQLTRDVNKLDCWHRALVDASDDEKMEALVEFIESIADSALSLPYAIRSRFIFATAQLCHQANQARQGAQWKDTFPKDGDVDFKIAEKYGQPWPAYPRCRDAFDKISKGNFIEDTLDFRHSHHHRFPPHVLIGLSSLLVRKRDVATGAAQYVWGGTGPLQLDKIADALASQCNLCYAAFEAFQALVREHEAAIVSHNAKLPAR